MTLDAKNKANRLMLLALFLILVFFIVSSAWAFYLAIKPPKIVSSIVPSQLGLNYEEVTFSTEDGLTLKGWWISPSGTVSSKTIIGLHGYPADKGNILPAIAFLAERYNLLLFDFRYLGESGGAYSTVGANETKDLLAAIAFLRNRGIREVGVWGFSMGAAVALMAAPQAPEIKIIVSESSYARLDLLAPKLFIVPILQYPLAWLTRLWSRIFLGIDLKSVSPKDAAANLTIPVLVVHSRTDPVVSFDHALMLQESLKKNPDAQFWFRDNLRHGELGADYHRKIVAFFNEHL